MNIKKTLFWTGIIVGSIIAFIIVILFINTFSTECDLPAHKQVYVYQNLSRDVVSIVDLNNRLNVTDNLIEDKYCYYNTESFCRTEELKTGNTCLYKGKGFFETLAGIIILFIIGILLFGGFVWFIYTKIKPKPQIREELVPFEIIGDSGNLHTAKGLLEQWFCLNCDIYHYYENNKLHFKNNSINWFGKQQDYRKNGENFMRAQVELNDGNKTGVYTVDVNLSRGEEYIKNGNFACEKTFYDNMYLKTHEMPRNEIKDPIQRRLEKLAEISPEAASKFEERILERESERLGKPETLQEEQLPQQIQQQQTPTWYNKRYKRR